MSDKEKDCVVLAEVLHICVGDNIVVHLRQKGARTTFAGVIKGFGNSAIVLEDGNRVVMVYLRDVKAIEVRKS